jgi:hypothetical protein
MQNTGYIARAKALRFTLNILYTKPDFLKSKRSKDTFETASLLF